MNRFPSLYKIALLAAVLWVALASSAVANPFVFTGVNIVDVVDGRVLPDQSIVVQDGIIVFAGDRDEAAAPDGAEVIATRGAWAIPGLWDMHVHLASATRTALPVFVANGVTHVRDMGGDWNLVNAMRDDVAAGRVLGPQILTCGRILESPRWLERAKNFLTESEFGERIGIGGSEDADTAIGMLCDRGVDFIKVRTSASRDAYYAVADAAREHGIGFVGHAPPPALSLLEASDAGQRSIEHYIAMPGVKPLPENRRKAFKTFKKNDTHFVPTMVSGFGFRVMPTEDVLEIIGDETNAIDPRRRFIADELLDKWRSQLEMKEAERNRYDFIQIHKDNLVLFGEMHQAGVSLMVGTDLAAPYVFPGFSVHDELAIFVEEMAISPMDALRAATVVPAKFTGQDDEFGAIRTGHKADFVFLEKNPLDDVRNVGAIKGVFTSGRWISKNELTALLDPSE